jgi:hypothetical protein
MTTITAEVIADSINPVGVRLTTLKLEFPRYLLPQFNTHRTFSRNAASSRAIPIKTMIERIKANPVVPSWLKNQKGMQPAGAIDEQYKVFADTAWENSMQICIEMAQALSKMGVAKEQANRLLEPFAHAQVLVTATDWRNFFALRLHEDAQSEIQQLAAAMKQAMDDSEPVQLAAGDWHLPFVSYQERQEYTLAECLAMSTARNARVSYWLHDGAIPSIEKDVTRHSDLKSSGHWSPFEHPAEALPDDRRCRNFRGFRQYRDIVDKQSWEG